MFHHQAISTKMKPDIVFLFTRRKIDIVGGDWFGLAGLLFFPYVRRVQGGESLHAIKPTNKPTKSNAGSVGGGNEINHLSTDVSGSTLLHKESED